MSRILKKSQVRIRKYIRDSGYTKGFVFKAEGQSHSFSAMDPITGSKYKGVFGFGDRGYYHSSVELQEWKGGLSANDDLLVVTKYKNRRGVIKLTKAGKKKIYSDLLVDAMGRNGLWDSGDSLRLANAIDLFPGVDSSNPRSVGVQIGYSEMVWV